MEHDGTTARQAAKEEAHATLLTYIENSRGSSVLRPARDDNAGTGLSLLDSNFNFSKEGEQAEIRKGDELLVIPECCFLTPRDGVKTPWGEALLKKYAGDEDDALFSTTIEHPSKFFLAIALLHIAVYGCLGVKEEGHDDAIGGLQQRQRSYWQAYIKSIPTLSECREDFPEFWTEEELASLFGSTYGNESGIIPLRLMDMVRHRKEQGLKEFHLLRECVEMTKNNGHTTFSNETNNSVIMVNDNGDGIGDLWELFQWARCMVSSRTFFNPMAFGNECIKQHSFDLWRQVARMRNITTISSDNKNAGSSGGGDTYDSLLCCQDTIDAFNVFMVPYADLANHSFDSENGGAEMGWEYCERCHVFKLEALKDIIPSIKQRSSGDRATDATPIVQQHRPMCTKYGKKTIQHLLFTYGFCPSAELLQENDMSNEIQYQIEIPLEKKNPRLREGGEGSMEDGINGDGIITWVRVGLGSASVIGTEGFIEVLRSSFSSRLCANECTEKDRRGDVIERVIDAELRMLHHMEGLLNQRLDELQSFPAARHLSKYLEDNPSSQGGEVLPCTKTGPLCSIASILYLEIQVGKALVGFAQVARALLCGFLDDAEGARKILEGYPLGDHVLKELCDYARSLRKILKSAVQKQPCRENLENEFRSDYYSTIVTRFNVFLGETQEEYDGPKGLFADIF